MTPLEERFWAKVDKAGPDDCWLWQGTPSKNGGYGNFAGGPGLKSAHRYSYWLATGEHPGALLVRHSCDTPLCCNPAHLSLGTITDNMADRHERGRDARGERVNHAKLTEADVLSIRRRSEQGESDAAIAASFGVTRPTVNRVCNRRTWKHVVSGEPAAAQGGAA